MALKTSEMETSDHVDNSRYLVFVLTPSEKKVTGLPSWRVRGKKNRSKKKFVEKKFCPKMFVEIFCQPKIFVEKFFFGEKNIFSQSN